MRTWVFFLPNLLFLGLVNAGNDPWYHWQGEKCLTDQEASDISTAFENFYVSFDLAQAESLIADDFQSISDSLGNFYPNFVVGSVTVPSKAEFILEESNNTGPYFEFTTLNVWHTCNVITFRWLWHVTPVPALGIDVLVMVWRDGRWQIQTDYSEFNDVVALRDLGIISC